MNLKGQCHNIQWFFALFCVSKKWLLLAQVSRTSARSAARTASLPKLSRASVVFRGFAQWQPLFSPHKMAAKNHRLPFHCLFNTDFFAVSFHPTDDRGIARQPEGTAVMARSLFEISQVRKLSLKHLKVFASEQSMIIYRYNKDDILQHIQNVK